MSSTSKIQTAITARRILQDRQFLASRDRWFRPVNFYVGPEGGMYVLGYYREYIEHPEWLAEDLHDSDALYNGRDRGRIHPSTIGWMYRVRMMRGASNERARALLKRRTGEREAVVEKYEQAVEMSGDPGDGEEVYFLVPTFHVGTPTATLRVAYLGAC